MTQVDLRGSVDAATGQGQEIVQELRNHVAKEIGPIAKPRSILVVPELPKTRSGEDHAPAAARRRRESRGR